MRKKIRDYGEHIWGKVLEISTAETYPGISEFVKTIGLNRVDYDKLLDEARALEIRQVENGNDIDFEAYTKSVVNTEEFERADYIINQMLLYPEIEKMLGFSSPKMILDPAVEDFYDFVSPKMKDENGKIVDNPASSFDVVDYDYKTEGAKLQERVPVAE